MSTKVRINYKKRPYIRDESLYENNERNTPKLVKTVPKVEKPSTDSDDQWISEEYELWCDENGKYNLYFIHILSFYNIIYYYFQGVKHADDEIWFSDSEDSSDADNTSLIENSVAIRSNPAQRKFRWIYCWLQKYIFFHKKEKHKPITISLKNQEQVKGYDKCKMKKFKAIAIRILATFIFLIHVLPI